MSGWDVSSTPTWGPQDGPEDTQATGSGDGSRDFGRGGPGSPATGFPEVGSGYPGEGSAGGAPPEFFGQDYGQDQELGPGGFPQRTPGRSLQDLPRREVRGGRHSSVPGGAYGQDTAPSAFGQESAFGRQDGAPPAFGQDGAFGRQDSVPGAFGQESAFGRQDGAPAAFGQDGAFGRQDSVPGAFGQESAFGRQDGAPGAFGQESAYGRQDDSPGAFGQESAYGRQDGAPGAFGRDGAYAPQDGAPGAYGRDGAYAQDSAPPGAFGQDSAYGQDWGGGADQADAWGSGGRGNDSDRERTAGRSAAPWEERPQQDAGYPGQDGQGFGQQDFGQQGFDDYTRQAPSPGFTGQDYDGRDLPGQQGRGPQEAPGFEHRDRDSAARMDPALQDFFAPQRGGGSPGRPAQGPGRPGEPMYRQAPADWANPGRSQAPRNGTGPRPTGTGPRPTGTGPRPTGTGPRPMGTGPRPMGTGPRPMGTGPRPMPRGPRRDDPEPSRGLGMRGLIAIGAVVAVIIVVAVVVLTHKSGGSPPMASNTPAGGSMTTPASNAPASKAAAKGSGTGAAMTSTAAYTLSTPATAGGYPMGQDPQFLATATATATQISAAVASGGGGTVQGKPVSASYRLPLAQVITFVGYKGTFTMAKIATIVASLPGTDEHSYSPGAHGGVLGCGNTEATATVPSGAVCVWATSSTLGITEFFTSTGPESLTASQSKGAADTLNLRADVETKS